MAAARRALYLVAADPATQEAVLRKLGVTLNYDGDLFSDLAKMAHLPATLSERPYAFILPCRYGAARRQSNLSIFASCAPEPATSGHSPWAVSGTSGFGRTRRV